MWAETTLVGCAAATCPQIIIAPGNPVNGANQAVGVCVYNPAGNEAGQSVSIHSQSTLVLGVVS